ncbi:MAG: hypothetical protein KY476_22020 [Planctomycetes bacterium]|nr:hypothetical protein [Planctomycetota bacterium]
MTKHRLYGKHPTFLEVLGGAFVAVLTVPFILVGLVVGLKDVPRYIRLSKK